MIARFQLHHPVYWQHDRWYRRSWYLLIQTTTLVMLYSVFVEPLPEIKKVPTAKWAEPSQGVANYQGYVTCMNENATVRERGDACDSLLKNSYLSRTDLSRAYYGRSLKSDSEGRTDDAILDLSSALEFNADKVLYFLRGDLYQKKGKFSEAKNDYTKSLLIDSSFADPRVGLARIYFEDGDINKAEAELQQAIMLKPKLASAYYYLGQFYLSQKKFSAAVSALTSAISTSELPSAVYFVLRASAYLQQNNIQLARADINRAKIISPLDQMLIEFEPKLLEVEFLKKSKYYQENP